MQVNQGVKRSRKNPNFLCRASWHDYASRCIYMVTVSAAKDSPRFSSIKGEVTSEGIRTETELFPAGKIIKREIEGVHGKYPSVSVLAYCVMPDHCHIVIFIRENTGLSLSHVVAAIKAGSTSAFRAAFPESPLALAGNSLFSKGFNDRIVRGEGQTDTFCRYVNDNPKRYFLRKTHPEFFNRCRIISINGNELAAFGNLLLLRHCVKSVVKVSRTLTVEEVTRRERVWSETVRSRGVLVSPFISEGEKAVRNQAVEGGASIIHILPNGFPERFKPYGRDFDLCAEGRLLLIAPVEYNTRKAVVSRGQCLAMNELAALVAADGLRLSIIAAR